MAYQRNDVLLVPFPYSDLSATKVRPAIVVSSTQYHQQEPDLLLVAITSNLAGAHGLLDYVLQYWRSAGLKFPSALKPVLFTLDPNLVIHTIGTLHSVDIIEIDKRLRSSMDL